MKTPLQGFVLIWIAAIAGIALFKPLVAWGNAFGAGYGDLINGGVVLAVMLIGLSVVLVLARRAKR